MQEILSDILQEAQKRGLIKFDENFIHYIAQNKKRNFNNPEEKVQAECYAKLILEYDYPKENISLFESVQMGSSKKEADIIVYKDSAKSKPYIIVECKKQDISDLEFKSATDQAFSYATSMLAEFIWVSSGLKDEYFILHKITPRKKSNITDIPKFGSNEISEFKFAYGGVYKGKKMHDLTAIDQSLLTQIFKSAHNALWGGGELNPSAAFDELDKLIFCKIWDEKNTKYGEPYKFQTYAKFIDGIPQNDDIELRNRINELYKEGRKKDPEVFKEDIRLNPAKIRSVVGYLEKINLSATDLDAKGRAFETFMGSFFRGDFGQYFTPRPIVKFIVDSLPINEDSFVLDSSCGSGGFLLHALDKVRKLADIAYPDYLTNREQDRKHYTMWHGFAENNLFGIEINEQIARVAKMNMIIHDDGHTNVIASDGLVNIENMSQINPKFKANHFDFIITNPPFGSIIKQTERAYLHQYNFGYKEINWLDIKENKERQKRENQSTEVLFIEQAHNFLKVGGILAIVIPDGILTNSSLQYVRDQIEEMYQILAVISMPQIAFSHTGAGVKSSVLFLRKNDEKQTNKIKNLKANLQEQIKQENDYLKIVLNLELEKKAKIKELDKLYPKEQRDESYKAKKEQINAEFKEKLESLQGRLSEFYAEAKKKAYEKQGLNYPIFMAIAENIGYDATGKETTQNDLDIISIELAKFIESILQGKTLNFH